MKKLILFLILVIPKGANAQSLPMKLWYDKPATYFEESLPIGNGKLGGLVYGGTEDNVIQLNDITFWTGKPNDLSTDSTAYRWIPEIRKALFNEDYERADQLQKNVQGPNSQRYLPLATLHIIDTNPGTATAYYRQLSLDSAVCRDRYVRNGVTYTREYFASNPDKVIAIHLKASAPGALNCHVILRSQVEHGVRTGTHQITMTGYATGDPKESIHFCSILRVKNQGGTVERTDTSLVLKNATEASLFFVNSTSFNGFDQHPVTQGAPYIEEATHQAWQVVRSTYNQLLTRHLANYRKLFGRMTFTLEGAAFNQDETTEEMLKNYGQGQVQDKYLEILYPQFARYLLISSSRTNGVPANLQGLWNPHLMAPWRGNYTVNINLEENYWACDLANLSEVFYPLATFMQNVAVTGARNAKNYYGIDKGWCCGHNSDIWAMSNPVGEKQESVTWSNWNMGGAWLMQNIFDHYLYTQDRTYLRNVAYPLMKGAADFMLDWLIDNPKKPGELITAPATSPEAYYVNDNGYKGATVYGGTADLAIIRELFTNTLHAAKILGKDRKYRVRLKQALKRLHPYTIGREGDINEWYYDWKDEDPKHRHQSHLIGLYPGHQISIEKTPTLAQAAAKSLDIKGDETTGWSTGWRINLRARLHQADQAYHIYRKLLSYVTPDNYNGPDRRHHGGTYPNLFDAHPPFQIDGNFGGLAGVCEMLMQSDGKTIELLPACPKQWSGGSINGLKARGGYVIGFSWKDGKVDRISISSVTGGRVTLKYNGSSKKIKVGKGKTKIIE